MTRAAMHRLLTRWRLWRLSHRPWDDETRLEHLRLHAGSLLDEPQEIAHWLYVTSAAEAETVAATLSAAGFAVASRRVGPDDAPEWELVASRRAPVTRTEITSARSLIEGLVDDYDGWLVLSLYEESIDQRVDRLQELLDAATGPVVIPAARIKRPPKRRRAWRRRQ